MPDGTVRWYKSSGGYGFIEPDDGSEDVFVHSSAVENAGFADLKGGQRLSFEVVVGGNGKPYAEALVRVRTRKRKD